MRTSNPTLSDKVLQRAGYGSGDVMTVNGSINKIGFLLLLLMVPAAYMWSRVSASWEPSQAMGPAMLGAIGGFVLALVTMFKKTWAPVTAPLYAVCQGVFLGGLSAALNAIPRYQGLPVQAVMLTFGVLAVMLVAYRAGWIRATDKFRAGVVAATGAIALLYMVSFIMSMFGARIPFIHEGGMIGIGFSVVVVGLAALSLILDFDFIEKGSAMGAPKYMEWYGAFGLLVTLVWLYLEILRLLMKLQSRD